MFLRLILFFLFNGLLTSWAKAEEKVPLNYQSCGEAFQLSKPPARAISMDINTSEIMLKLGLGSQMVAIAGVGDEADVLPEFRDEFNRIPMISASNPSLDALVGKKPDFVFGGWQYGFSESSGITPKRLLKLGINSYALAESCIRIQSREKVSLEDVFLDIESIGRIFGRQDKARKLIEGYRQTIASFKRNEQTTRKVRVFLYDSGEGSPFTAGRFAIPQAMIEAAGATNIFDDVQSSWTTVSWEAVVARKPEFVIVVDYGGNSLERKIRYLQDKFRKTSLDAMERKRFLVLPYASVTPGIRTVDATGELIKAIERHFPKTGT